MRWLDFRIIVPLASISLALLLAISPLFLLGEADKQIDITSRDLTEEQIFELQELELARNEAEARMGFTTITGAFLFEGELYVAGTWESEGVKFESKQNYGVRDCFVGKISLNGTFTIIEVFGSMGRDSIIDFEPIDGGFLVRGFFHGDGEFNEMKIVSEKDETVYEAHWRDGEWDGVWEIEEEQLQRKSKKIWCGF